MSEMSHQTGIYQENSGQNCTLKKFFFSNSLNIEGIDLVCKLIIMFSLLHHFKGISEIGCVAYTR
jgi:hypothetical protein